MNTKILHSANINKVRRHLRNMDVATKNTLAQRTMLSVATCGAILKEMIESKEVLEISLDKPTGGRPARRFVYNFDFSSILLIIIKHDPIKTMHFKLVNSQGITISSSTIELTDITSKDIVDYVKEYKASTPNLKVIGLSIPGVVKDGRIYNCCIDSLMNIDLGDIIYKETKIPAIIENDVNLAALCYYSSFRKDIPEVITYLYHPEGTYPGLGIVINGKVLRGKNNFAGEIMHMFVDLDKYNELNNNYSDKLFVDIFMSELHAITSLLAPEHLVISGHFFTKKVFEMIQDRIATNALHTQYPKLLIERDMNRSIFLGIQQLSILHLDELLKELYHD